MPLPSPCRQWRARQPASPAHQLRLYYATFAEVGAELCALNATLHTTGGQGRQAGQLWVTKLCLPTRSGNLFTVPCPLQVAAAVGALLERGIVHFDLKCDNCLLEPLPGEARVARWVCGCDQVACNGTGSSLTGLHSCCPVPTRCRLHHVCRRRRERRRLLVAAQRAAHLPRGAGRLWGEQGLQVGMACAAGALSWWRCCSCRLGASWPFLRAVTLADGLRLIIRVLAIAVSLQRGPGWCRHEPCPRHRLLQVAGDAAGELGGSCSMSNSASSSASNSSSRARHHQFSRHACTAWHRAAHGAVHPPANRMCVLLLQHHFHVGGWCPLGLIPSWPP